MNAEYDADNWLRPIAVKAAGGVTYNLTITEAATLRRQLETAIRRNIIDHHPPTPTRSPPSW
jgi:hypothetical protein